MICRNIVNPSHNSFGSCLDYMLRSDDSVDVYHESTGWGGIDDLHEICDAANALAPLTTEFGVQARPTLRPFRHTVISLATDEDLSDKEMCSVSREVLDGLARKYKPRPIVPMVVAVHRDTDNVHTHILSVPVDIQTGRRIRAPQVVSAYRTVLAPIEQRLGFKAPKKNLGWNDQRFHLPFKTWVAMDGDRLRDIQTTLLTSTTWEQAIRGLGKYNIKFAKTGKDFFRSTRFYLSGFDSRKLDKGMSIQRDVFAGFGPAPTAESLVDRWGEFPDELQRQIEKEPNSSPRWKTRTIGGDKGELLHKRWGHYAKEKRVQEVQLLELHAKACKEARDKHPSKRSPLERSMLSDPRASKRELKEVSRPMKFSHWVESMADRKDPDAQWLVQLGNNGVNADPEAALQAEVDGQLSSSSGDELEKSRALQLMAMREKELQAQKIRMQAARKQELMKRKKVRLEKEEQQSEQINQIFKPRGRFRPSPKPISVLELLRE